MTKIELTDNDAEMFRLFTEHYDKIKALLSAGLNEMSDGTITMHFDADGKLRKIEKDRVEWMARRST